MRCWKDFLGDSSLAQLFKRRLTNACRSSGAERTSRTRPEEELFEGIIGRDSIFFLCILEKFLSSNCSYTTLFELSALLLLSPSSYMASIFVSTLIFPLPSSPTLSPAATNESSEPFGLCFLFVCPVADDVAVTFPMLAPRRLSAVLRRADPSS